MSPLISVPEHITQGRLMRSRTPYTEPSMRNISRRDSG